MISQENMKLGRLLEKLEIALSERENRSMHSSSEEYLEGVKKALPAMEKALADIKAYVEKK